MRSIRKLSLAIVTCVLLSSSAFGEIPQTVRANWDALLRNLKQASELRGALSNMSPATDRGAQEREFTRAVYSARNVLVHSDSLDYLDQEQPKIDAAIQKENQKIERYVEKRNSAPEKSLLNTTKETYDRYIQNSLAEKERLNSELFRLYDLIAHEYANTSPTSETGERLITSEDVKSFLAAPLGRNILENINVFRNVKSLTETFGDNLNRNPENLSLARDYYDIYLTLLDILILCQDDLVEEINGKWSARLSGLERHTAETLDEVRRAMNRPGLNERQKELLRKNVATNELTVKAIQIHKQLLEQQKRRALDTIKSLKNDQEVLRVTKLTLQNAAVVQELMHDSLQIIDSLAALSMPDLQIYSDEGLRSEFDQVAMLLQQ